MRLMNKKGVAAALPAIVPILIVMAIIVFLVPSIGGFALGTIMKQIPWYGWLGIGLFVFWLLRGRK